MEELVKQVAQRTGISEDNARTAVTTVLGFLKDKLPAPIAGQIDNVVGGGEGGGAGGDIASAVGGLLK
jgi:outer membrane lipoprotein SlyB